MKLTVVTETPGRGAGIDQWGNVLELKFDGETGSLSVTHGDESGGIQERTYHSSEWASADLNNRADTNYHLYPDRPKGAV